MSGLGVVLSGGGARGAYEVGVLSYAFQELARGRGAPPIDFICATSVGAVNGAFLAGVADDPAPALSTLVRLWTELEMHHVMEFGFRQLTGLHRVLLGGAQARGIFDASPLARLVGTNVSWRRLRRNLAKGKLRALTITATHVATGHPVVFVDASPHTMVPRTLPRPVVVRGEHITPEHVLASAAIPLIFPPIQIRSELYCDGGLRLNTPMAPAIHLGADRLLVITVSSLNQPQSAVPADRFPGAPFLLGKVLNAFLLDHVNNDLEELRRINGVLEDAIALGGPDFLERMNRQSIERGLASRHIIRPLTIRPSVDIGHLAAEHMRRHGKRFGKALGRSFFRLLDVGEGANADLASYLLFDGEFAQRLIELGRADAAARRDELLDFLFPP